MIEEIDEQKFLPPTAEQTASGQIWAQMSKDGKPFEPLKAYEAFLVYCDLGAARSIGEIVKNKLLKSDKRTLERYSAKYDWQRRAFAFDRYVARIEANARDAARFNAHRKWTERREEVREHEWNDAQELHAKAKEFLAMPLIETKIVSEEISDDGETIIQHITKTPLKGSLADVVRMIELADKLQRFAVDAPSDRVVIETPESRRHSDVLKARAAFVQSGELFPDKPEIERAESIARAFGVTISELLAPEENLTSLIQDKVSDLVN